jgi:hypothetical protein
MDSDQPLSCLECGQTILPGETIVFRWAADVDEEGVAVQGSDLHVVLLHPECQPAFDGRHDAPD